MSVYDGWSILELERQPLCLGGVAMERGLECQAKEGVEEGRGAEVEGHSAIGKLLTQTSAQYMSKLSILQQQEPLDGSEVSLDGARRQKMIQ